jgi:glycosyltransferase involved in cell wall biosynthesis
MKIAHVIPYFQPKFGYSEYYLMTELKRLGHEVCIITSDRYTSNVVVFDKSIDRKVGSGRFIEYGLVVYRMPTLFESQGLIINLGLTSVLENFKPDIVHVANFFSFSTFLAVFYKKKFGYKLFFNSITGTFNPNRLNSLIFKFYKLLFTNYIRKNSDGFFAISNGSKRWLSKNFSIPYSSINVIPLGADNKLFKPDLSSRQVIRNNFSFLDNEIVLIYTGKITPDKDINVLIGSVALVVQNFSKNIKILIIGNGSQQYLKYLRELAMLKDIHNNVVIIPTIDRNELPKYYSAADIAVWPGAPSISIIEAMSTELPIIICKYPERREDAYDTSHLLEYENGLSFNRGDHVALAACIEKLMSSVTLRNEMGKNSRKLVENKMNWALLAEKTLKIYENYTDK